MPTSLFDLTVGSYTQVLSSSLGILNKGKTYCEENGIGLKEMLETKLRDDMQGLYFQIVSYNHHSANVIRALSVGEFGPPAGAFGHEITDADFDALIDLTQESIELMQSQDADTVNGFAGKPLVFKLGENEMPFTVENFVLSFSLPNFYFHSATAYDIFRMKGVPLGKRDFLGQLKIG